MSTYDVRRRFAVSTTPTWSDSTGSVYPSVKRLLASGLLEAAGAEGARKSKALAATQAGHRAALAWVSEFDPRLAAATPDPIRTRTFSLPLLDPQARSAFFERAIRSTELAIEALEHRIDLERAEGVPEHDVLAGVGALRELEARHSWLLQLREAWKVDFVSDQVV